jgi:ABC-type lipoprotein export system ATPase subunit
MSPSATVEKPSTIPLTDTAHVVFLATNDARERLLLRHPEAAVVASRLPLRANLNVLENIAVVAAFRFDADPAEAERAALRLIRRVDLAHAAYMNDPDLSHEERFLAKLLRAVMMQPPMILIDRPGRLLPDTCYPPFLRAKIGALKDLFRRCTILDYEWNARLY